MDADVDHPLRPPGHQLLRRNELGHWELWNRAYAHWQPTLTERYVGLTVTIADYELTWCEPTAASDFVRKLSL